jgi:hypothetical protein
MYSNNNKSVMFLNGANSITTPFDTMKNQNDMLMKKLEMIETLSFNMNALQQTMLNHIEDTKKRDYFLVQLVEAVKKDQQVIISEKIVEVKEHNYIKFNADQFNNFFTTEQFTMFMKKYLSRNCSMNDYM